MVMKEEQKQELLTANVKRKAFYGQRTSHYEGVLKLIMLVLYLRILSGKVIQLLFTKISAFKLGD
jgi:hypothetical protein